MKKDKLKVIYVLLFDAMLLCFTAYMVTTYSPWFALTLGFLQYLTIESEDNS